MSTRNGEHQLTQVESDVGTRRKKRETVHFLERAVKHGWNIPDDWKDKLPQVLAQIAADSKSDHRSRIRAIEALRRMARDHIDAVVELDRIDRLETGDITSREEVYLLPMKMDGGREL